jgi:hypothetical protein
MSGASQTAALPALPDVDASTRFLVELDRAWSLYRLYGEAHPAFRHSAAAVAASADGKLQISISPKGFSVGRVRIGEDGLLALAQRLRRMGLVGLAIEKELTAAQGCALILALHEADRRRRGGEAAALSIALATDERVRAAPLRLGDLDLVERIRQGGADDDQETIWQELFARALSGTAVGAGEAARAFEAALRSVQSPTHWSAMVGVWLRELSAIETTAAAAAAPNEGAGPNATSPGAGSPGAGEVRDDPSIRMDAVATFLHALSPALSQRLLRETISSNAAPARVMSVLGERLPAGVVLGALSAVDRNGAAPSSAALALLRSVAAHIAPDGAATQVPPRTNAELAEIGASLERLLESNQEGKFVPAEYFKRRDELSRSAMRAAADAQGLNCPVEQQTRRHAAGIVLQMLSNPEADPTHLVPGLDFLRNRMGEWVSAGEFEIAAGAMAAALVLRPHDVPAVASAARTLLTQGYATEDLLAGCGRAGDRQAAVAGIAELLGADDGIALARVLRSSAVAASHDFAGAGGITDPVVEAVGRVLSSASEQSLKNLFGPAKDEFPAALLPVLAALPAADAVKAAEMLMTHAPDAVRQAVGQALFDRNVPWPLTLTERLLKDGQRGIRRLAIMRLVRDNSLPVVAGYLRAAARGGTYTADVALGLAELLRPRRREHPEVRAAWRTWFWSRRRWLGLLSLSVGHSGKGRAGR